MNVVKEINKINQLELDLGVSGASWHDEYRDSAYIFVGGLPFDLTEGDVITIFSQYGEVMDVNMPRDKETGKRRGFAFLMYEDQRSTVLAVDNLNGAVVLEKTLRVDHVKDYKQPRAKGADGEWVEPDEQSLNARPELIDDDADGASDSSASSGASIDPEDPMRDYLLAQRREAKALKKAKKGSSKSKGKHKDETPEERRARKARKAEKRARKAKASEGTRGVEQLLSALGGGRGADALGGGRDGSAPRRRRSMSHSRSPPPQSRRPGGERNDRGGRDDRDDRGGRSERGGRDDRGGRNDRGGRDDYRGPAGHADSRGGRARSPEPPRGGYGGGRGGRD